MVTMIVKCDHGNYIPQGENKAIYCTGCCKTVIGIRVSKPTRRQFDAPEPKALDAAEYMQQPIDERLAAAEVLCAS